MPEAAADPLVARHRRRAAAVDDTVTRGARPRLVGGPPGIDLIGAARRQHRRPGDGVGQRFDLHDVERVGHHRAVGVVRRSDGLVVHAGGSECRLADIARYVGVEVLELGLSALVSIQAITSIDFAN